MTSRSDDARANVVADIAAPTNERLFLSDAHPLAGALVEPDVLRKIGEALAQSAKLAVVVASRGVVIAQDDPNRQLKAIL